jgi:hypothetical protein
VTLRTYEALGTCWTGNTLIASIALVSFGTVIALWTLWTLGAIITLDRLDWTKADPVTTLVTR